uniref:Uncharacterized protein n=1 Tax=Cacopsylla melanoneura TaxID=428564 RepID=A0A8D9FES6_9HEMI
MQLSSNVCLELIFLCAAAVISISFADEEKTECIKWRGYQDELADAEEETATCVFRTHVCYTIMQDDNNVKIVSKHCGAKNFCENAKRNMILYLTYCKECNATKCNDEKDIVQNVFPEDIGVGVKLRFNLTLLGVCFAFAVCVYRVVEIR